MKGYLNKFLLVLFFLFFFLLIVEMSFYFLSLKSRSSLSLAGLIVPTSTPSPTPVLNVSKQYFIDLLKSRQKTIIFSINGLPYIKPFATDRCTLTPDCFTVNNRQKAWRTEFYSQTPVPIPFNNFFVMKVDMKTPDSLGGVTLTDVLQDTHKEWWQGASSIYIAMGKDGKYLHVEARNGHSQDSITFLDQTYNKQFTTLYVASDIKGRFIEVFDESLEPIVFLDTNKQSGGKFPNGIFPNSKIYLGYSVAPESSLTITDFLISPID